MAVTVKRTRVSKNKKRNWRKHSNIDDVEEYLEEERFNERIGGAASQKSDETLYFVEKKNTPLPDTVVSKSADVGLVKKKLILENLKCFQGLKSSSQVPIPIQPNFIQKERFATQLRKRKTKLTTKLKQNDTNETQAPSSTKFYDIWASNAEEKPVCESELDQKLLDYTNEITKKKPPKVPVHRYQKPSLLPAVEVPLPGASYNPEFYDHQALLLEAVKIEQQYEKECRKLERSLTEKFPTVDQAPTEETWLAEMSQGLEKGNDDDKKNEHEETSEETGVLIPPVYVDKKSKQKKRKEKEEKKKIKEKIQKKLENKRLNEVYRIRSIKKELHQLETISQRRKQKREEKLIEKMYKPLTLSKYKYESPLPEFNLSEELSGQLRTLKMEGNILEDRYKSLQRRNLIEPRIRQKRKRKYKLKVTEKRGHREFQ